MNDVPIKDAATVLLLRHKEGATEVLMGQRGAKAVFMPDKFVFPGGRVDESDRNVPGTVPVGETERALLDTFVEQPCADSIANAAIRELWEETGLTLGKPSQEAFDVDPDWAGFYAKGLVPDASGLSFFFRAVTPPGRPRRFDARFLLCDVSAVLGDPDDFSEASGELSHLQWVQLSKARSFSLPFITDVVLCELQDHLANPGQTRPIPFFDHGPKGSTFRSISAIST